MSSQRGPGLLVLLAATLAVGCGAPVPASPSPALVPTVVPIPTPTTATTLTKDDAEAIARRASERWADGDLLDARLGSYSSFANEYATTTAPVPSPEALVWWISLGTDPGPLMGQGEIFIIDASDGHVVQHYDWIS